VAKAINRTMSKHLSRADITAERVLADDVTGEPRSSTSELNEARAARQAAQDALDAAMDAHATLTKGRSGSAASFSERAVEDAIGQVVLPAFVDLLGYYRAEQDRLTYIKQHL
jgi:hypothetical protein